MRSINISEKLALFSSHWDPHVVSDYNDNDVMVVKFKGEYPFHKHETTDDFFYVLEGEMIMDIEGNPLRWSKLASCLWFRKALYTVPEQRQRSRFFS